MSEPSFVPPQANGHPARDPELPSGDLRPAASPALRASIAEQAAALRGGGPLPDALLDLALEQVPLPSGAATVVRPRDWRALRAAAQAAGEGVPYWAIPWPSGRALARAVARAALRPGARVLELGCGLALPSLAAARAGGAVLATDASPDAVVFAAHVLALNGVEGEVARVEWREARALLEGAPWDLVLAADVLYLRTNVEALLELLPRLLAPDGEAWLADPGRAGAGEFLAVARRLWRLDSRPDPDQPAVTIHRLARRT